MTIEMLNNPTQSNTVSPEQLSLSVVICAYTEKRWDDVVAAVLSLENQTRPPDEILLVIDHNPMLLTRVQERFPRHKAIENRFVQGLSGGRNTALEVAQGDLLAFLDDDATAEPDWLELMLSHITGPEILGVGGKVEPNWTGTRPKWFPEEFYWVIGCSYRGQPTRLTEVRNPFGGCMVIRRQVVRAVGGFRTEIGRVGTIPLGAEETEMCIRARQRVPGGKFLYEPRARIHHRVIAARATWGYFASRCYAEGLSKAAVSRMVGAKDGLSAERSYSTQVLPVGALRGLRDLVFHFDVSGLQRSFAIVYGLLTTARGYLIGRWKTRGQTVPAVA